MLFRSIAVARRDYIQAVKDYNLTLRTFPSVLWATLWFRSNQPFQNFTVAEDKMEPPKVDFGSGNSSGGTTTGGSGQGG